MRARSVALAALLGILATTRSAGADEAPPANALLDVTAEIDALEPPAPMPTTHLLLKTGAGTLRGPNARLYLVPQGSHVLDPGAWVKSDAEFLRLQEAETRLTAENKSLREDAEGWQPGWKTLVLTLAAGVAGGWYLHSKI